jgi:hypothetical protein
MNFRSSRKINDGFSKRKRPNCEDLKTWRGKSSPLAERTAGRFRPTQRPSCKKD